MPSKVVNSTYTKRKSALTVGIIYGGKSSEHDVSRCSAASVAKVASKKYHVVCIGITREGKWYVQEGIPIQTHPAFGEVLALETTGNWCISVGNAEGMLQLYDTVTHRQVSIDIVFPLVHGTYGEDGTLQGLLEMVGVPYIGPGVLGSAVGMDKAMAKQIVEREGIPVVPYIVIRKNDMNLLRKRSILSSIEQMLPVFVKPANAGSSIGITKVVHAKEISDAIHHAFKYDTKILVEKAITCRELEVSVIGNDKPKASIVGEVIPKKEYYSYEAKYVDKDGASLSIPAKLPRSISQQLRDMACRVYTLLGCEGMARVDFFMEVNSGILYFNEINTLPGFTSISMYPKLWEHSGMSYEKLIDTLIRYAYMRHHQKIKILQSFVSLSQ